MIDSSKKVTFPDSNEQIGIAALSERDGSNHILRIYQLVYNEEELFEPIQELAAFSFLDREELTSFLERLPSISGLEMLMLLNPLTFNQGHLN